MRKLKGRFKKKLQKDKYHIPEQVVCSKNRVYSNKCLCKKERIRIPNE
jgi:hypothetical protein